MNWERQNDHEAFKISISMGQKRCHEQKRVAPFASNKK